MSKKHSANVSKETEAMKRELDQLQARRRDRFAQDVNVLSDKSTRSLEELDQQIEELRRRLERALQG
ncbi:MAG: hypothetical protein A49_10590 [Methyloceanibacter sp.]|nr:MAG: hypothetical protein A49_10590 [Methyloceanibacter sp.]